MKKIILFLIAVLTLLPLFRPGFFDVHDPTSLIRFYTLTQSLGAGQFPAAWTNLMSEGFGYPLFLYYAPVFSYLGVIIKLLVPSYLLALKFSLGLIVLSAAFGMYRLMYKSLGGLGALISAAAYTTLPYHAATLYVRGSYAEGITWAILPWLLYIWSGEIRDKKWIASTSIVTALFFMSHNSLPFVFIPFLLLWILLYSKGFWKQIVGALILSVGLSLWFLLPVLFERNLVQIDRIANATIYSDHFVGPAQLWHSPWGFGGSAKIGEVDGMSFMLGKFQIVLAIFATGIVVIKRKWSKNIIFFLAILIFYAFMTTPFSAIVWSSLPELSILQFPWRVLAFASFGIAALTGHIIYLIPKPLRFLASILVLGGLLIFNLKFFKPQQYMSYLDQDFINDSELRTVAVNKIPEYLPANMPSFPVEYVDDGFTHTPVKVYGDIVRNSERPIEISTAWMPQWKLLVGGDQVDIAPSDTGAIISSPVSVGPHHIELIWQRTFIEKLGLWISAISLVTMIGLLLI